MAQGTARGELRGPTEQTPLQSGVHRFSRKGTWSLSQPQVCSPISLDLDLFESLHIEILEHYVLETCRRILHSQYSSVPTAMSRDPQTASSPVPRADTAVPGWCCPCHHGAADLPTHTCSPAHTAASENTCQPQARCFACLAGVFPRTDTVGSWRNLSLTPCPIAQNTERQVCS